jgi:hypothetical protein
MIDHKGFVYTSLIGIVTCIGGIISTDAAFAATPYTPVPVVGEKLGGGLLPPRFVRGKEYSHDLDVDITPIFDPQQIIAWDGIGGVANGIDYTGDRPTYTLEDEMDALAHHRDAYYANLLEETSHLIFSVDDEATALRVGLPIALPFPHPVPSAGPLLLTSGEVIGGAGELSYELGTNFGAAPNTQGLWASQLQINNMPIPNDVDGLELWGDEPGIAGDTDKYSLEGDLGPGGAARVSIWNDTGGPYVLHSAIVGAVTGLLGAPPTAVNANIDLDALMVLDSAGVGDDFGRDVSGNIDQILFSIRQIPDPTDPTGYYATGSEIFLLNAAGIAGYLTHGGHIWDKPNAVANMAMIVAGAEGPLRVQLDINALEANVAPEPTSLMLVIVAMIGVLGARGRRR